MIVTPPQSMRSAALQTALILALAWSVTPLTRAEAQEPAPGTAVPPAPAGSEDADGAAPENFELAPEAAVAPGLPLPHLGGAHALGLPHAFPALHDECAPEAHEPLCWVIAEHFVDCFERPHEPMAEFFARVLHAEHDHTPLDVDRWAIGLQALPPRPRLVFEPYEPFLGTGWLEQGIVLPTCAVWRPAIWVFGEYRTHVAYRENSTGPSGRFSEWANRLDLFGQLNLSGTERIVLGVNPLDEQDGTFGQRREFTSYDFRRGQWIDGWNTDIQTFFFEGDFGEIFPNLDPYDRRALDYGFSVGRQPLLIQDGLLINEDRMDMVTVTRNTLNGGGNLNLRMTGAWAWNEVNRHDLNGPPRGNFKDDDAQLFGLFTESDFAASTVNVDAVYLDSESIGESLVAVGVSAIQRINGFHNTYNTAFHVLASFPTDGETEYAGQGELLFTQIAWTPHGTEDVVYVSAFWAIDQFTSPARAPLAGGPLGQVGILFAHAGLGRYGPALNNQTNNAAGGAIGYQMFFDHTRQQVTVELGGRSDTDGTDQAAIAGTTRYQRALGQHWIFLVEGFLAKPEEIDLQSGVRTELLLRF